MEKYVEDYTNFREAKNIPKEEYSAFLSLVDELVTINNWMGSDQDILKICGAKNLIDSSIRKYQRLSKNTQANINFDLRKLEKKAIDTLVTTGNRKLISEDLIRKYGV